MRKLLGGVVIGAAALGADPTGQVDASTILQAALNAHGTSESDGITITFNPGEIYKVCSPLKLISSNEALQGLGTKYSAQLRACTANQQAMIDLEAPYVSVSNLFLLGVAPATSGWAIESNVQGTTPAYNCNIDGVMITGFDNGISLYNSTNCTVTRNKIYSLSGAGMVVVWGSSATSGAAGGAYIAGNQLDSITPAPGPQAAVYIWNASQNYIMGNDMTGQWSHAVYIENSFGNIIKANTPSTTGQGPAFDLGPNTSNMIITDNNIVQSNPPISNPYGSPGSVLSPNVSQ